MAIFGLGRKRTTGDQSDVTPQASRMSAGPASTPGGYAGFWIRALALGVDSAILLLAGLVLVGIASTLGATIAGMVGALLTLLQLLYWPVMHASPRQASFGKQMLGLRVIHAGTGERISIGRALLRDVIGKLISSFVLMLGFLVAAFTSRKQALHDYVGRTVVVREGPAHVARAILVSLAGVLIPAIVIPVFFAGMMAGMMAALVGGRGSQAHIRSLASGQSPGAGQAAGRACCPCSPDCGVRNG